jgi:hypothetical protein
MDDITEKAPLFLQNFRPFDSLEFQYVLEEPNETGSLEKVSKETLRFDARKKMFKLTRWKSDSEVIVSSNINGKQIRFTGNSKDNFSSSISFVPVKTENISGRTNNDYRFRSDIISAIPLDALYADLFYEEQIFDFFTNEEKHSTKLIDVKNEEEMLYIVLDESIRYKVNKRTGLIAEKVDILGRVCYSDYVFKYGFAFPTALKTVDDKGKVSSRWTIKPESIKVNQPYSLSDFNVIIPAGSPVYDATTGKGFTTPVPISFQSFDEVEKELKELIKQAEKMK